MFGEVSNEVEYFPGAVTNIQNIQYNSFLNGIFEKKYSKNLHVLSFHSMIHDSTEAHDFIQFIFVR